MYNKHKSGTFMNPYIYQYFDKQKNKTIYIGKTNGRDKSYRTGSKILKRYISIYGYDIFDNRFDRRVIEHCNTEDLDLREEYYIQKYNTLKEGVNLTKGGKYDWKRYNFKPVLQYNMKGEFLKEWVCGKDAFEDLNLSNYDGISACCKNKQKSSGGYIWRYKTYPIPPNISQTPRKCYKKREGGGGSIPVTIEGIKYKSKTECMNILNISQQKLKSLLECQK